MYSRIRRQENREYAQERSTRNVPFYSSFWVHRITVRRENSRQLEMENVINRVRLLAFVDDGIIMVMKMMLMIAFRIPLSLQGREVAKDALLPVLANDVEQQEG